MLADPLPPETDLPADAVVFRGGTMQAADLARAFASHYDKRHDPKTGDCLPEQPPDRPHYCYALSVNAAPDLDLDAIALRAKRPNGQARVSSTTRISMQGFRCTKRRVAVRKMPTATFTYLGVPECPPTTKFLRSN